MDDHPLQPLGHGQLSVSTEVVVFVSLSKTEMVVNRKPFPKAHLSLETRKKCFLNDLAVRRYF